MEKIILNNTPVRTCRNFRINNVEIDSIPNKFKPFKSVKISQETGKDEVIQDYKFDDFDIKFGTGLLEQTKKNSNQNIRININSITNKDINLEFDFDEENSELIDNIEIVAKENTSSNIYIIYKQKNSEEAYHNGLIRVLANPNSKVTVNIINLINEKSLNILAISGKEQENANIKYNIVDFGGKESITNLYTSLDGEKASNQVNTIYLGNNQRKIDINYIIECFGKKTKTNIEVQGALKDESVKHFKGTIDFKKGCKKAVGAESENCMLLSDKAKAIALPMLLCSEEDVEGNHAASSGKADPKEMFYLNTRGFDEKSAEKLLVRAKFNSILEEISNEEIKEEVLKEIDEKLN